MSGRASPPKLPEHSLSWNQHRVTQNMLFERIVQGHHRVLPVSGLGEDQGHGDVSDRSWVRVGVREGIRSFMIDTIARGDRLAITSQRLRQRARAAE